jgi:hypothetical protein
MQPIPLPIGTYRLSNPTPSCRRLVNCYAEEAPPDRPKGQPVVLRRAPGIRPFTDTQQSEVRGGITMPDGTLFVVAGAYMYRVSSTGSLTQLSGDAISGNGPVRIATNGTDIVVCPGNGHGFASDGTTVTQITDPVFVADGGGADPVFVDQFIVFRRPNTARFFNTGLNALTFDGMDIATAEGAPGNLVGMIANNRELVLAKEQSTELWYNAANPTGSPFSRSPSGFKEAPGCAAGLSLCNQDNAPFMLASDRTIRRLGSVWEKVSHPGVESILQRMPVISDCIALPFTQCGHPMIAFTFRNAGRTLVYDVKTSEWHERDSLINTVSLGYWRPSCILQAYGMQIVGDSQSGKLGILDPDTHEEWGEPQRIDFAFQPIYANRNRVFIHAFELHVGAGVGLITGQGSDPLVTLFISSDDGQTWRAKNVRSLGKIGQYQRRVKWHCLGSHRAFVARVQITDPVPLLVVDALIDVEGGTV